MRIQGLLIGPPMVPLTEPLTGPLIALEQRQELIERLVHTLGQTAEEGDQCWSCCVHPSWHQWKRALTTRHTALQALMTRHTALQGVQQEKALNEEPQERAVAEDALHNMIIMNVEIITILLAYAPIYGRIIGIYVQVYKSFHEMKSDRDGKSAKRSATRFCL